MDVAEEKRIADKFNNLIQSCYKKDKEDIQIIVSELLTTMGIENFHFSEYNFGDIKCTQVFLNRYHE